MRATAVRSANDMALAIGEHIGGSEARFTNMMTMKAEQLGMTQTRYVTANGLPDARQLTSARDQAILARAIMRDFLSITAISACMTGPTTGAPIATPTACCRRDAATTG